MTVRVESIKAVNHIFGADAQATLLSNTMLYFHAPLSVSQPDPAKKIPKWVKRSVASYAYRITDLVEGSSRWWVILPMNPHDSMYVCKNLQPRCNEQATFCTFEQLLSISHARIQHLKQIECKSYYLRDYDPSKEWYLHHWVFGPKRVGNIRNNSHRHAPRPRREPPYSSPTVSPAHSPRCVPSSCTHGSHYAPTSPPYVALFPSPTSPPFVVTSPTYVPTSPPFVVTSPTYVPTSSPDASPLRTTFSPKRTSSLTYIRRASIPPLEL
jgi:hypothetical protein